MSDTTIVLVVIAVATVVVVYAIVDSEERTHAATATDEAWEKGRAMLRRHDVRKALRDAPVINEVDR